MSASLRITVALGLVVLSMGLGWTSNRSATGYLSGGYTTSGLTIDIFGDLVMTTNYMPGYFIEGDPLQATRGFESDMRIVLVPAAFTLAWTLKRRGVVPRKAFTATAIVLGIVGLWGLSGGIVQGPLVAAAAALLVWSVALDRRRILTTADRYDYSVG